MISLKTSYFARAAEVPCPVSIALFPPEWFRGLHMGSLAPSCSMFSLRRKGLLNDADFEVRYVEDVLRWWRSPSDLLADIDRFVKKNAGQGTAEATLLCFERPGQLCHRRFLARWLEAGTGIVVPEYGQEGAEAPAPAAPPERPAMKFEYEPLD